MHRKEPTVLRRTLARATEIAGTDEKLAKFLDVPVGDIRAWASGEADPPLPFFLALMDIVAANFLSPAALKNLAAKLGSCR